MRKSTSFVRSMIRQLDDLYKILQLNLELKTQSSYFLIYAENLNDGYIAIEVHLVSRFCDNEMTHDFDMVSVATHNCSGIGPFLLKHWTFSLFRR